MKFFRRIPWWVYVLLVVGVLLMFGKTKVSVGNVSVGGKDLGGFKYDSEAGKTAR